MSYEINQAEQDWAIISNQIDKIEPEFKAKLQKAINLSVSADKVEILHDRKTLNSAYEKCLTKKITFYGLCDLLRAKVLYSRTVNPENIINGLVKVFGRGNIEIDRREFPAPGREYFGPIHITVKINNICCEIQLMRKNLHSYVMETRKYYKDPSGKRVKNMPEKQRNIERSLFERGNRPQEFEPERFEPEIEMEASLLSAINMFYKFAVSKKTIRVSDDENKKMVKIKFPEFVVLKATDGTKHKIELEPEEGEDAIYVVAPIGYKFKGYQLHEMIYDPLKLDELKKEELEPCIDPNCDYCSNE